VLTGSPGMNTNGMWPLKSSVFNWSVEQAWWFFSERGCTWLMTRWQPLAHQSSTSVGLRYHASGHVLDIVMCMYVRLCQQHCHDWSISSSMPASDMNGTSMDIREPKP
jgi:hypothetical protein